MTKFVGASIFSVAMLLGVAIAQEEMPDFTGIYDGPFIDPREPPFQRVFSLRFVVTQQGDFLTFRIFVLSEDGSTFQEPTQIVEDVEVSGNTFVAEVPQVIVGRNVWMGEFSADTLEIVFNDPFRPPEDGFGYRGDLISDRLVWDTGSGNVDNAGNWAPAVVPGEFDVAVFNREETYTVDIAAIALSLSVLVDAGMVTFAGGFYENANTEPIELLTVGGSAEFASAGLTLLNHQLSSRTSVFGEDSTAIGTLTVDEDATWSNSERATIGLNGSGELRVVSGGMATSGEAILAVNEGSAGFARVETAILGGARKQMEQSQWNSGNIVVGQGSDNLFAEMTINGGAVVSGNAIIGQESGSVGRVDLGPAPDFSDGTATEFFISSWDTANLVIGDAGEGQLLVTDSVLGSGASVVLGKEDTGIGTIEFGGSESVTDWLLPDGATVTVGESGNGMFTVNEGNFIVLPGEAVLGRNPGSRGDMIVNDGSALLVDGDFSVGAGGQGFVFLMDGAGFETRGPCFIGTSDGTTTEGFGGIFLGGPRALWGANGDIRLGALSQGENEQILAEGRLVLDRGVVQMNDNILEVNRGSRIAGNGAILGVAILVGEGVIDPEIDVEFEIPAKDEPIGRQLPTDKQNEPLDRTLEVGGDLMWTGGLLDVTVNGTADGEFDRLAVSGDATLDGTTLAITFGADFTPTTGDEFPVLAVDGALVTENLVMEIEGTDPSFEFDLIESDGMLMLMTTQGADAQEGQGEEGSGEGQGEEGTGEGGGEVRGGCPAAASVTGPAPRGDVLTFALFALLLTAVRRRGRP